MKYNLLFILAIGLVFSACKKDPDGPGGEGGESGNLYFPPSASDVWEMTSPDSLGWDLTKLDELKSVLQDNETRGFILLKDGKIVVEEYWGKTFSNLNDFDASSNWYWASAGKTLTAFTVGKAQEENYLDITDKSSKYLGENWTSLDLEKEDLITIKHQLSMTTGLDDNPATAGSILPEDLKYLADPGTRWSYHNGPYTILDHVVEDATQQEFEPYFNSVLQDKIGMEGLWLWSGENHLYWSNARSMARFGLLMLNKGKWVDEEIMEDQTYFEEMINPSQTINNSYGYLWWLNGRENYMLPQSQVVIPGSLTVDAPDDMYSALGKNSQYLCVVPSENLVLVRLGANPDEVLVPLLFLNDIWAVLKDVINP